MYRCLHKKYETAQLFRNVSSASNQHIRMISEGSCDTEDWSNDAENTALHHRNKLHIKKKNCFNVKHLNGSVYGNGMHRLLFLLPFATPP